MDQPRPAAFIPRDAREDYHAGLSGDRRGPIPVVALVVVGAMATVVALAVFIVRTAL